MSLCTVKCVCNILTDACIYVFFVSYFYLCVLHWYCYLYKGLNEEMIIDIYSMCCLFLYIYKIFMGKWKSLSLSLSIYIYIYECVLVNIYM